LRAGSKEQGAKSQRADRWLSVFVNGIEQKETKRTKGKAEWSERDERHGRKSREVAVEVAGATEIQWSERDDRPAANEFQTLKARRRD
jgi:hypothetical protein